MESLVTQNVMHASLRHMTGAGGWDRGTGGRCGWGYRCEGQVRRTGGRGAGMGTGETGTNGGKGGGTGEGDRWGDR